MSSHRRPLRRALLALCLGVFLVGCASVPRAYPPAALPAANEPAMAWHSCRAKLSWETDQPAPWDADGLLAVALFAPLIESLGPHLEIWRFHRRAGRDGAGRRFSFIYRASELGHNSIVEWLEQHPLRMALHAAGVLEQLDCSDVAYWSGPGMGATSDAAWSPAMQEVWPQYIHGVSRMWLELMRMQIGPLRGERSLDELLAASAEAQRVTTLVWQGEGQHALLHHLNAVFAYQPLLIRY